MQRRAALVIALLAACNDVPTGSSASDGATGSSTQASTSGHVSSTSTGAPTTSGSASVSESGTTTTTGPLTASESESGPLPTSGGATTSAGTTDPGTASTGTTDSGTSNSSTTDPGTTDPGTGTTDPGTTGTTGTTDPGTTGTSSTTGIEPECEFASDCPAPECWIALCPDGQCAAAHAPPDFPCGGGVCDGDGACVACLDNADCPQGQTCIDNACVPPSCQNGIKDGAETDVDCGGPTCPSCLPGEGCMSGADCDSGVCQAGQCQPATCGDGAKNGDETDIDCGGGTCPACADGDACVVDDDCDSGQCDAGVCTPQGPACANQPPDPSTGQRCPIFMPCTQSAECGVFQDCQQWFCNNAKTCELNALSNCGTTKGGGCNAGVVFVQHDDPPVDKRFLPPDGVDFREVTSLAFTIHNNTGSDIYLDKLPLALDLMGGGSTFDVSSAKIFDNSGGTEHGPGDILVCLTANPFTFPANGVLGPCGGSSFARVPAGGSNQYIVNLAFAKEKTFIAGRSYRLRLQSLAGVVFTVGYNGPAYAGTMCGVPGEGYVGAWVTAQNP